MYKSATLNHYILMEFLNTLLSQNSKALFLKYIHLIIIMVFFQLSLWLFTLFFWNSPSLIPVPSSAQRALQIIFMKLKNNRTCFEIKGEASCLKKFFCIFFIASKIHLLSQECIPIVLNWRESFKGS